MALVSYDWYTKVERRSAAIRDERALTLIPLLIIG